MSERAISVDVVRIPTKGPGDVSGLMRLIETGKIAPAAILAVLGKTEGNGGVNDFTREYAMAALCEALAPQLGLTPRAVEDKIAFVMSGGTEGVLSPHLTVFTRTVTDTADGATERETPQHRHRPHPRLPAGRDRSHGPDRGDGQGGASGHARRRHRRSA